MNSRSDNCRIISNYPNWPLIKPTIMVYSNIPCVLYIFLSGFKFKMKKGLITTMLKKLVYFRFLHNKCFLLFKPPLSQIKQFICVLNLQSK